MVDPSARAAPQEWVPWEWSDSAASKNSVELDGRASVHSAPSVIGESAGSLFLHTSPSPSLFWLPLPPSALTCCKEVSPKDNPICKGEDVRATRISQDATGIVLTRADAYTEVGVGDGSWR